MALYLLCLNKNAMIGLSWAFTPATGKVLSSDTADLWYCIESMKKTRIPVIFFHGAADCFVPCYMSEQNFAACTSEKKRLVITPDADHGLCFPIDTEGYLRELREFFEEQ